MFQNKSIIAVPCNHELAPKQCQGNAAVLMKILYSDQTVAQNLCQLLRWNINYGQMLGKLRFLCGCGILFVSFIVMWSSDRIYFPFGVAGSIYQFNCFVGKFLIRCIPIPQHAVSDHQNDPVSDSFDSKQVQLDNFISSILPIKLFQPGLLIDEKELIPTVRFLQHPV